MFVPIDELSREMSRMQLSGSSGEFHVHVGERIIQCRLHTRGERESRTIFVFRWNGNIGEGDHIYHLVVDSTKDEIEKLVASLRQDGDEQILAKIMSKGRREETKPRRVEVATSK